MFQLDNSKSLHKKWFFHHFHPLKTGCLGLFRDIYDTLGCSPGLHDAIPSGEIRTIPRWRIQKRRSCPVQHRPCASGRNPRFLRRSVSFCLRVSSAGKKNWAFSITTWWFQTQLKNMIVKLDHVPKDQGENKQNVWNHYQDYDKFGCVFAWRLLGCSTYICSFKFYIQSRSSKIYIATRIPYPEMLCLLPAWLPYGWWKKSGIHQLRLVVYPIIYRVLYIPGGAGFLPSTVSSTSFCENLFFTPFFATEKEPWLV